MKNKLFGIFAILLMIFGIAQNPILATLYTEITDPTSWTPSIRDLVGTSSVGTWTLNSTAEYYEAPVNVTTNGTCWIAEFQVPDCYMGMDVWKWNGSAWVLMNGQTGYSLSVPYYWNFTDKITGLAYTSSIPADWGSGSFVVGTPSAGSLLRVQLWVNENAQLKIRIRYSTTPAIGFDGYKDAIITPSFVFSGSPNLNSTFIARMREISLSSIFSSFAGDGSQAINNGHFWLRVRGSTIAYHYSTPSAYLSARTGASSTYEGAFVKYGFNATYGTSGSVSFYINDTLKETKSMENSLFPNATRTKYVGSYKDGYSFYSLFGELSYANLNDQLIYTPFSWNGTHFVDLSGNGNHGTPYDNVQYKVYTETGFKVTIERFSQVVNEGGSDEFVVYSTQPISSTSWDWKSGKLVVQSYGNITVNCTKGARLPFTVWYDSGDGWRAYGADFPPFTAWTNGSAIIYEFYSIPSGSFMIDFADADTTGYVPPPVNGGGGGGGGGGSTVTPPPPVHEEEEEGGDDGDGGGGEDTFPTNVVLWGGVAYAGLIAAIALILVMGGKKR